MRTLLAAFVVCTVAAGALAAGPELATEDDKTFYAIGLALSRNLTGFPLNGVIKCWTEGLQKMKVGGKATLVCPSDIAYGDQGRPPQIKPGATLVFDVELIEIVKK